MMQLPERTLIYDRDISGHHLDYLQFLVEYLKNTPEEVRSRFVFVVHEGARERFQKEESLIRFHYIDSGQLAAFSALTSVLQRATAEMRYLVTLVQQYEVERLIFMHIDAFQYELGKRSTSRLGVKFSGLLFLPFRKYYESGTTLKDKIRREWRGWRKGWQMRWMLRNPRLERIFFLNDRQGVEEYNARFGPRFEHLPDPIDLRQRASAPVEELRSLYGIPAGRTVFLIYGHLSSRKNIPNILAALQLLNSKQRSRLCLLICGEPEKGYESTLFASIHEAQKKYPELGFSNHFQFFNPAATNEVFKIADIVLVPYIHFFSSSNILGLAAKYGKPLIASKLGVMGALVNQYQLGITVAPNSPEAIANAMSDYLSQKEPWIDGSGYLKDYRSEVFCQKLLFSND
ncbi:glycosyltransferase [Runella slithyformis]|uniref:Glycosyl transferase group 1 n=1 Tax=Runella slithyformis (strain ATCC 29530 / DSM 19594 / LMG 11500 / NCIMB 11436 / LSU 4) TaxID=761193 RepID=A0A7U3ZIS8_RUNSL|nr:glycosyltransferase [Runella slithyformis]AEI47990.1 glycosyl transferase group 1 [Runella slithyformis DSM 19594]